VMAIWGSPMPHPQISSSQAWRRSGRSWRGYSGSPGRSARWRRAGRV